MENQEQNEKRKKYNELVIFINECENLNTLKNMLIETLENNATVNIEDLHNNYNNNNPVRIIIKDYNSFRHEYFKVPVEKRIPVENFYVSGYWNVYKYSDQLQNFLIENNINHIIE